MKFLNRLPDFSTWFLTTPEGEALVAAQEQRIAAERDTRLKEFAIAEGRLLKECDACHKALTVAEKEYNAAQTVLRTAAQKRLKAKYAMSGIQNQIRNLQGETDAFLRERMPSELELLRTEIEAERERVRLNAKRTSTQEEFQAAQQRVLQLAAVNFQSLQHLPTDVLEEKIAELRGELQLN